jgi:hypothetical protein
VRELQSRLRAARCWAATVSGFAKNKPTLDALRQALTWDPPPVAHPGEQDRQMRSPGIVDG